MSNGPVFRLATRIAGASGMLLAALFALLATNASFATIGATVSQGGTTYTRSFGAPGTYYFMCGAHFSSMSTTATLSCGNPPVVLAAMDIDGNGQVDAATDGLLVLRYLLGMRGAALVNGALGVRPSRDTSAIENYLATRVVPKRER